MAEGDLLKTINDERREEIRKQAEGLTGHNVFGKKFLKLGLFTRCHSYKFCTIEIGKYLDKRIAGSDDEEVGAIFEAGGDIYLVCTPNHGIEKGNPYIFRNQEVYSIVEEE